MNLKRVLGRTHEILGFEGPLTSPTTTVHCVSFIQFPNSRNVSCLSCFSGFFFLAAVIFSILTMSNLTFEVCTLIVMEKMSLNLFRASYLDRIHKYIHKFGVSFI